jgi:phytoene synthase
MTDQPQDPAEDLDAQIKRVDPDRWLSSRFIADEALRADVIALYAFDHEIARIPGSVSQPLLGEIKLAWWREGLDEVFAGGSVRGHPTLQALAGAIARHRLPRISLDAMIEARVRQLDPTPFADEAARDAWLDAVGGTAAALAAGMLAPDADANLTCWAGRVWVLSVLARRPAGASGLLAPEEARALIGRSLKAARADAARLPAAAFPAVAHAALARTSGRGDVVTRLRLFLAVATGRI